MKAGNISIDLELNGNQFTVQVKNTAGLLRELRRDLQNTADATKRVQEHYDSFSTHLRNFMLTVGSVRFALLDIRDVFLSFPTSIAKTSGEFERLHKLMQGLSTAATDAGKALEATKNMNMVIGLAKNSPFEIKAISDAFVKLKSGGIDPTNGSLKTLIDGVAKFGGTSDTLHRASIALMQMSGKGVISMEELRQQLGEAIPNAMQLMADGAGISMAELVQKVSKGTVEAKNAIAKMLVQMEIDSSGAAEKMMETIPGALARLQTSWELFKNEIGKQGFSSTIRDQMSELSKFLDSPEGIEFARQLGKALESATVALISLQKELAKNWELIKNVGEALFLAFAGSKLKSAFAIQEKMWEKQRGEYLKQKQALEDIRKSQAEAANGVATRLAQEASGKRFEAENLIKKANAATQEAGKLYAEAHSFLNKADKLESTVPGWAGKKVELLRSQAEGYKLVTQEIQQNAVAMRQRASELQKDAQRIDAVANTQRKIASEIANGTRAIRDQNGALAGYSASLGSVAGAKQRLANAAGIAGSAIVGFGRSLLGMVGWGLAVQATFSLISWGYDKIFGSVKRAADEQERFNRIKRGESTKDDLKEVQDALEQKRKDLADAEKTAARFAKTYQGRENTPDGKAFLEKSNKIVANLKNSVAELEKKAGEAAKTVIDAENEMAVSSLTKKFENRLQEAMAKTGVGKEKQDIQKQIAEAEGNSKLVNELLKKQKDLGSRWISEKKRISAELISKMETEIDGKAITGDNFKKFKDGYYTNLANSIEQQSAAYDSPLKELNKKGAGGSPAAGLHKYATSISADLEVAKEKWQNVLNNAGSFATLRAEAEEEIKKLLDEGKLNTKLKGKVTEKPTMENKQIQEMVDRLTMRKLFEEATRELPNVRAKANELTAEANAIMQAVNDGSYGTHKMEKSENRLLKTIEEIEKRSPAAVSEIRPLREEIERMMGAAKFNDATKQFAEFTDKARKQAKQLDVEAKGYYLTQEEARQEKQQKELDDLAKTKDDVLKMEGLTDDQRRKIGESYANWRSALERRQAGESITQLERMKRQWEDITYQMNQATASWANKSMDFINEFVSTGKGDFKSFVTSILKDIQRMSLQGAIGGAVTKVTEGVGEMVKGVLNFGKLKQGEANPFENAIGGAVNAIKGFWASITGASGATGKLAESAATSAAKTALEVSGISAKMTAEQAATASLTALAAAAYKASGALGGSSGGGVGGLLGFDGLLGDPGAVDAASWGANFGSGDGIAAALEWFENGGIMTEIGSVPLRKYANGGIANTPQMAVFGEGKTPEAYVPLPDGRSIPVTMSGAITAPSAQKGDETNVTIQINVTDSGSNVVASGGNDTIWKGMADKVRGVVQDELATQRRPGGMLYR